MKHETQDTRDIGWGCRDTEIQLQDMLMEVGIDRPKITGDTADNVSQMWRT